MSSNPTSTSTPRPRRAPLLSRRGRAGLAGCAVLLAAAPLLAGCAAGDDAQTLRITPDNGEGKVGAMYISNVWVVLDQTTGNAEVIGQVANTNPQGGASGQLTGVAVGGVNTTITPPADTTKLAPGVTADAGSVTIPALESVEFGQPGQPELMLPSADVTVGSTANITYSFADNTSVTVAAIVEPNAGLWALYNPNGPNTATPSASASPAGTATPTGTATPSGTATPTGTATPSGTATPTGTASGSALGQSTATATASATH